METQIVGTFPGVSYSTVSEGERIVTLHTRLGTDDDPYAGWKQSETLTAEKVELPDGETPENDETEFLGENDRNLFKVSRADGTVTISEA